MSEESAQKRSSGRSRNYPGIDLKKALERAQAIYNNDKEHWSNIETVMKHLGYSSSTSGPAQSTFAALKKYGLLEDEGSGIKRRARLTNLAVRILIDNRENSTERAKNIQTAALTPDIHNEIWKEYNGSLPSDSSLIFELRTNKGFTDSGASDFVKQFRRTIEFARLTQASDISSNTEDKNEDQNRESGVMQQDTQKSPPPPQTPPAPLSSAHKTILLPLMDGTFATLSAAFPLNQQDWDQMVRVLEAMKPGLIKKSFNDSSEFLHQTAEEFFKK